MQLRSVTRNTTKKKSPEAIQQELLASIIEIADEEAYLGLNEEKKVGRNQKSLCLLSTKNMNSFSKEKIEK